MDPQILARKPDLASITKKKRMCHQVDFLDVPDDHKAKIKETENLNLAKELKGF